MNYRDYDQEVVGKYINEYGQLTYSFDERLKHIKRSMRKSLGLELIMGIIALGFQWMTRDRDTLAPIYYSMLWGAIIGVTLIRMYFAGRSLRASSVGRLNSAEAYGKIRLELMLQLLLVILFVLNMSIYEGSAFYGVRILLIGCSVAMICYAFSYMSYNLNNLRWWEFQTPYIKRSDD